MIYKLTAKYGDVTIELQGKNIKEILKQYKEFLWQLGLTVPGGRGIGEGTITIIKGE